MGVVKATLCWAGSILHRSCTTSHNGRLGSVDDVSEPSADDLSEMSTLSTTCKMYPTLIPRKKTQCFPSAYLQTEPKGLVKVVLTPLGASERKKDA